MSSVDRDGFRNAMPAVVRVGDVQMTAYPKVFSTGSLGWHAQGKLDIHGYRCQVNIVATVVGSKPPLEGEQKITPPETALNGPPSDPNPSEAKPAAKRRRKAPDAI